MYTRVDCSWLRSIEVQGIVRVSFSELLFELLFELLLSELLFGVQYALSIIIMQMSDVSFFVSELLGKRSAQRVTHHLF